MSGLFGKAMRFAKSKQGKEALDKVQKYAKSEEGKERIEDVKGRLSGKKDTPVPTADHEAPKPDPAAPQNPAAERSARTDV
jgi:hypothetical protein